MIYFQISLAYKWLASKLALATVGGDNREEYLLNLIKQSESTVRARNIFEQTNIIFLVR